MSKFELDLSLLDLLTSKKEIDRIPVKGNEDKMVRVAFDLFRLNVNNKEDLWQVQADDDGNEFLVRTYNLPGDDEELQKTSRWEAYLDKKAENLTIVYDGVPVNRLVTASFGISNEDDANIFKKTVINKLANDKDFAELMLGQPIMEDIVVPSEGCHCDKGHGFGPGIGPDNLMPEGTLVLMLDADKGKEEKKEKEEDEEDSPSEDYTDANNWWENLSEKDQEELFDRFKDVPSITKEQAFKLVNMELKLAQKTH